MGAAQTSVTRFAALYKVILAAVVDVLGDSCQLEYLSTSSVGAIYVRRPVKVARAAVLIADAVGVVIPKAMGGQRGNADSCQRYRGDRQADLGTCAQTLQVLPEQFLRFASRTSRRTD